MLLPTSIFVFAFTTPFFVFIFILFFSYQNITFPFLIKKKKRRLIPFFTFFLFSFCFCFSSQIWILKTKKKKNLLIFYCLGIADFTCTECTGKVWSKKINAKFLVGWIWGVTVIVVAVVESIKKSKQKPYQSQNPLECCYCYYIRCCMLLTEMKLVGRCWSPDRKRQVNDNPSTPFVHHF